MLTVISVLRCTHTSQPRYTPEWVKKLRDGVARNLKQPHRFVCLSDVDVPCERIPLEHDWGSWWAKIELFRKGVIEGETLYLDLDTVITGPIDLSRMRMDFGMLRNFWQPDMVGSGVMYFSGENVPHKVYDKFVKQPQAYIRHHERNADGPYVGDQAFIWDALDREIIQVNEFLPGIKSYKFHCVKALPKDASIVCFHGRPRPSEVNTEWMAEHWNGIKPLTESDAA